MNRLLAALPLLAAASCARWHHAPGHESREAMVRVPVRVETGRFCQFGLCDLTGPAGRVAFSETQFAWSGQARTESRFTVSYGQLVAACDDDDATRALSCSVSEVGRAGPPLLEVALSTGCTEGALIERGTDGADVRTFEVRADRVDLLGRTAPGKELSLVDRNGTFLFSEAGAMNGFDLFARKGTAVAPAHVLALAALHGFVHAEGTSPRCLSPSTERSAAARPRLHGG